MITSDVRTRLDQYAKSRNRAIGVSLGHGTDGGVWKSDKKTAIKVFHRQSNYETERDCYRILMAERVTEICGFTVPRLVDFDNELMVVEMDIVEPPYILDFGKAYLNREPPHFSPEVMADWYRDQQELWGDYWPTVRKILGKLRSLGIYQIDAKPGNIRPANWNPSLD